MKPETMENVTAPNALRQKQIPPEALEVIADVLLASSRRDDDHPAYNEDQLSRKRRHALQAELYFGMITAARYSPQGSSADYVLDHAGLTQRERTAWAMYSDGHSVREIARFLQIARPTAVRLLRSAARRISACEAAFRGLGEVYHREVHRYIYRRPMHCSEQPCRRLGYCKYAIHAENQG